MPRRRGVQPCRSTRRRTLIAASVLLGVPLLQIPAAAQETQFEIIFENDVFMGAVPGVQNSDREYTHGLSLGLETNGAPLWGDLLPRVPECDRRRSESGACTRTRFETGHKIFTPDYHRPGQVGPERPFAGWLFGSVTGKVLRPSVARSLRLDLGVTGRPALGEEFQRLVHKVVDVPVPKGWDHQLGFEPGVLVQYGEDYHLAHLDDSGAMSFDAVPAWRAAIGNVRSGLEAGVTVRVGSDLPHPWMPTPGEADLSAFAFVGVRQNLTLRDLFLDGNTFEESEPVDKRPLWREGEVGVAVDYRQLRLVYSFVLQTKLYKTQPRPHRYAAVRLIYRRDRD